MWVPAEAPGTEDIKGQNESYHLPGKRPKPGVVLANGDQTATVLTNEDLPTFHP